jgi:hypothetical protein
MGSEGPVELRFRSWWWFDPSHPGGGYWVELGHLAEGWRRHQRCTYGRCFVEEPLTEAERASIGERTGGQPVIPEHHAR